MCLESNREEELRMSFKGLEEDGGWMSHVMDIWGSSIMTGGRCPRNRGFRLVLGRYVMQTSKPHMSP